MAERHRTCEHCGKQFSYLVSRGADRRLCSKDCQIAAQQKAESNRLASRGKCSVDGCCSPATRVGAVLCETHYCRLRRTGKLSASVVRAIYQNCQYCGNETGGNKYCSARCATRAFRGAPSHKSCDICDSEYSLLDKRADSACCSEQCRKEMYRRWLALKKKIDPDFVARVRRAGSNRRARKADAYVEDVDRDAVMARDKWTCHLCREKIPKNAVWPDGLFGTLDHVTPLAKGGKHSYANIKAAHLVCNCSKGAKLIGQMGLEFAV